MRYGERPPPKDLADVVHVFWELRTLAPLPAAFLYHAVPDACVNLLFNQIDTEVAGVTALHTEAITLNLGTVFHYVGVQFFPAPGHYRKAFGVRFPQDGSAGDESSCGSSVTQEHAMHKPNAIGWFDLYVDNLDRATAFYESVLQRKLTPIGDPTGETVMHSFPADMGTYGASGALVRSPHGRPGPGGTLIYFSVDDCVVEAGRVTAAGGQLLRPKFSIGEFGWVALCADTEGNVFGLSSMR